MSVLLVHKTIVENILTLGPGINAVLRAKISRPFHNSNKRMDENKKHRGFGDRVLLIMCFSFELLICTGLSLRLHCTWSEQEQSISYCNHFTSGNHGLYGSFNCLYNVQDCAWATCSQLR